MTCISHQLDALTLHMLPADVHTLHESGFYRIRNFKCNCTECHTSKTEYSNSFNFCFVRSGYFEFDVFRRHLEVHVGRVLISKPGSEHVAHHIDDQPDVCTLIDFKPEFYQSLQENYRFDIKWFFENNNIHSILVNCGPEIDHLHHLILTKTQKPAFDHLQIDDAIILLVEKVMSKLGDVKELSPIATSLKKFHLSTIEKAKNYILAHFDKNIGLQELSEHCCVSLFHFSRIFKEIMGISPHQYLTGIRLNHARVLLENTHQTVSGIASACGYSSMEHFATAYRQRYKRTPTSHRNNR